MTVGLNIMIMRQKIILFVFLFTISLQVMSQVRLLRNNTRAMLEVNGKPMLILGGELSNSAATSVEDIDEVIPRMKAIGLNTLLVPAQWDLIEPEEGKFDFKLIDETVLCARDNGMKVVFLWFGAWKNSMSCYAPLWFKQDVRRFPRAMTRNGKPLEIASAFSENVLAADKKAFLSLVEHIAEIDGDDHTVVMIQVENEIGMLEDARDYSPLAEKVYSGKVPSDFLKAVGITQGGTWGDVLKNDVYGDEQFMAYWYARYVEQLANAARKLLPIPFFVNAAMNSRGRIPGEYPSAGPLAHLKDIWHCGAPSIDILAPDIYDTGFKSWTALYALPDNPLFIPESRCCANSGVRALYVFGEHESVGFSPFAIDLSSDADAKEIARAYALIGELSPLLINNRGRNTVRGVLFDADDRETAIFYDDIVLTCSHYFTLPWDSRKDLSSWREGGGIIIQIAKDEFLVAGSGIVVAFQSETEKKQIERAVLGEDGFADKGGDKALPALSKFKGKRIGIGYVDEVTVESDGTFRYVRRLNGDQSHQGRHVRISVDDYKILHVKLYEY